MSWSTRGCLFIVLMCSRIYIKFELVDKRMFLITWLNFFLSIGIWNYSSSLGANLTCRAQEKMLKVGPASCLSPALIKYRLVYVEGKRNVTWHSKVMWNSRGKYRNVTQFRCLVDASKVTSLLRWTCLIISNLIFFLNFNFWRP